MTGLAAWFERRRVLRERRKLTGKRWTVADHRMWGNSINFDRTEGRHHHWHGWTWHPPVVGDEFTTTTSGGLTASFMVTSVETCRDPEDMWFATTHRLGVPL